MEKPGGQQKLVSNKEVANGLVVVLSQFGEKSSSPDLLVDSINAGRHDGNRFLGVVFFFRKKNTHIF